MYVRMYADRRCSCQKYMGVDNIPTAGACWEYRYFLYYTHTQLVGNNKIEQEHLCRLNRFTYPFPSLRKFDILLVESYSNFHNNLVKDS